MYRYLIAVAVVNLASGALAQVSLLTQERTISASTTANGAVVTRSAPDFNPFVDTASSLALFQRPDGTTGVNTADTTINCFVDPNAIRAFGSLSGTGGIGVIGGAPAPVFGEAAAFILITFDVTVPTPYWLTASPRPSTLLGDEYEIELSPVVGDPLFFIDETSAPQAVNVSGVLQPGQYTIQYQVEVTSDGSQQIGTYDFGLTIPSPGSLGLGLAGLAALARRRRR